MCPMWIDLMTGCRRLLVTALLLPLVGLGQGEEGQYRSKIRIDTGRDLGTGSGMSIEELERQIASISDAYGKSSAGRHLARHYVEEGDYDKAIEYYRTALAANGLADVAKDGGIEG